MSIIPIKLERTNKIYPKVVEWQLGNTCNYDCYFCPSHIKNGSRPWIDLEKIKSTCQSLMDSSSDRKIKFQFTGGEPTLYKDLDKLLRFVHDRGHITTIFSNGSRTIRYWSEIASAETLDILVLSFHLHQGASIDHFKKIIDTFSNTNTLVVVMLMATKDFFNEAVSSLIELQHLDVILSLRGINENDKLDSYTKEQLQILQDHAYIIGESFKSKNPNVYGSNLMTLTYDDGTAIDIMNSAIQVDPQLNNFYGWECSTGQEFLDIKYDTVYRSMCQVGGPIGTIHDEIGWKSDTVVCDKKQCGCAIDMLQTKKKTIIPI